MRVLAVLRAPNERGGRNVSQLARDLGISRQSLYRILETLQEAGFVARRGFAPPFAGADSSVLRAGRSPFVSSLSRRTIPAVLRISASLKSSPIVAATASSRALNAR
jgi:predicted ArsR family transcriptional regulator